MGWQLSAKEREAVSAALNSAILESRQLPGKPPLEVALAHTKELIKGSHVAFTFLNIDLHTFLFKQLRVRSRLRESPIRLDGY